MENYSIYDIGFDKSLNRDGVSSISGISLPELSKPVVVGEYTGGISNLIENVVSPQAISSGAMVSVLFSGKETFTDTTAGYRMGVDTDGIYKWIIGGSASSIDWAVTTANTLTIVGAITSTSGTIGGFTIGSDYIRDAANSFGLASSVTGGDDVRFWAGDTFANRATAPFRVTESGAVVMSSATVNGSSITNNDIYGSGEDGNHTVAGTETLTKDTYYDNLTVPTGTTLIPAGFRIFVKSTLTTTGTGKIAWNGNNGSNGTAGVNQNSPGSGGAGGSALSSGALYGSGAGKTGGAGGSGGAAGAGSSGSNGTAGDAITNSFAASFSSVSGTGGTGGTGGSAGASGGSSGASGSISSSTVRPYTAIFAVEMFDKVAGSSPAFLKYNSNVGGAGGGGGGTAGTGLGSNLGGAGGGGGGSGSGGGTVVIAARTIVNNGSIQAIGGNGGNGGNGAAAPGTSASTNDGGGGGGGGGTGGPGGTIVLIYSTLSGSGTVSAAGGTGGTGGTGGAKSSSGSGGTNGSNGSDGSTGVSGKIITLIV